MMRGWHPNIALAELTDVDDSGKQQFVSHYGLAGERHSSVYRPQSFGLSARPPKGSTGLVVSLGGERSRAVFLGGEHERYRPTDAAEGEAKLYDSEGNVIFMGRKGGVSISTASGDTTIKTAKGKATITAKGDVFAESAEGKVYLGSSDGQGCFPVVTTAGPSTRVFSAL